MIPLVTIFSKTFSYEDFKNKYKLIFKTENEEIIEKILTIFKTVNKITVRVYFNDVIYMLKLSDIDLALIKKEYREIKRILQSFISTNKKDLYNIFSHLNIIYLYDFRDYVINESLNRLYRSKNKKIFRVIIDTRELKFRIYLDKTVYYNNILSDSEFRFSNRKYKYKLRKIFEQLYFLLI